MKKVTFAAVCWLLLTSFPLLAQTDWHLGGNTLSSSQRIGTNNSYSLIFETNNSDRGRITSGGNWGIGTTDPTAKLHINSTVSNQHPLRVQTLGITRFLINSSGTVGIGIANPDSRYALQVVNSNNDNSLNAGIYVEGYNGIKVITNSNNGNGVYSIANGPGNWAVLAVSEQSHGIHAVTNNPSSYAGFFQGNVFTTGTYLPSDAKLKQNIADMGSATTIINKLKPKGYEYKTEGIFARMNLPRGKQYGLLSQDVEQVLPGLVKEVQHIEKHFPNKAATDAIQGTTEEVLDFKAVNYTGLIPIMIKAMQEQQQTIQQLQEENRTFKERFARLEAGSSTGSTIKLIPADPQGISLEQNQPNPAGANTTFRYTIPNNANAQILLYHSATGKLIKTLQAPVSGQVELNATDLEAGTYIYTLVVEGKQEAARQLILSK